MSRKTKIVRFRRARQDRASRSSLAFAAIVVLIAAVAFTGPLMWSPTREAVQVIEVADIAEASAVASVPDFECEVAYVNDGDTLRCGDGTRLRLHAIAARETDNSCSPGHPCPTASASFSRSALIDLAGRTITCNRTGTSHDRVTAICWNSAGIEINCAMVRSGAAVHWERFNRQEPICG